MLSDSLLQVQHRFDYLGPDAGLVPHAIIATAAAWAVAPEARVFRAQEKRVVKQICCYANDVPYEGFEKRWRTTTTSVRGV